MKAYRGNNGKILLFRPDLNMKRMLSTAERSVLPVKINIHIINYYKLILLFLLCYIDI